MTADYIFVNGEVVTVNARDEVLQAAAVKGTEVLAAGTTEEMLEFRGPRTEVIDLNGRSLLPGFIDAHLHFLLTGTNRLGVDCKTGVYSLEDISGRLADRVRETPPGEWVRGWGYNDAKLSEERHPRREDLDKVSTRHPILVTRACNHISAANSRALDLLGISSDTPDPDGGTIERDPSGTQTGGLTGVLKEAAHMRAFRESRYPPGEMLEALSVADKELSSLGITSIHEAGGYGPDQMRTMQQAVTDGRINTRIYAMVCSLHESEVFVRKMVDAGVVTGLGDERFRVGPAKIFTDGSSSGPTCATREPYTSDPDDCGILYYGQEEVDQILGDAHRHGFQITAHAIGDRGVEMVVNCIEKSLQEYPREDHRHRIEHAGMVPSDLLSRIRDLGIVPIPNPAFFYEFGEGYIKNYGDRVDHMFPLADYAGQDIVAAAGSDSPVTSADPMQGIYCAVTRKTASGTSVGASQKIQILDAIRAFTLNGAYASFEENRKGSIEAGKLADLVVLNGSILSSPPEELLALEPALTMVGGEIVFDAGSTGS